jgi:hypothetical protein
MAAAVGENFNRPITIWLYGKKPTMTTDLYFYSPTNLTMIANH